MNNNNTKMNDYMNMSDGYTPERTEIIISWIGRGKRVLDIGCFDGRESYQIKKQGNDVIGIDKMKSALQIAKKRGIKTYELDVEKDRWSFRNNLFDVVLAGEIIEHLTDPDNFLVNIKRVLKPEGILILSTPNLASLGRRILLFLGRNPYIEASKYKEVNGFPSVGHLRYFVKDSLYKILEYHGFTVEKCISDRLNYGIGSSTKLARLFPSLGIRFIVRAKLKH